LQFNTAGGSEFQVRDASRTALNKKERTKHWSKARTWPLRTSTWN